MNLSEFYEKRKGTLAGGALGIALAVTFLGQSWREAQRFQLDPSDPAYRVCLDLTPDECVAKVANDPRVQTPESRTLDTTDAANRIGARQRARTTTTTGSTSSPSQPPSSTGGSSSPPTTPTPTRPRPSPSGTPSRPPSTTSRPAPTPSRPPSTPPTSSRPAPSPPSSPTPSPSAPPATPPPGTTVPSVPSVPPPVNVPVPPLPAQICTPFVGVNCPNGSVQAQRITGKGPGSIVDPVRPGEQPSKYDVDPSTPSDNVNTVPNRGNNGEGSP